MASPPSFPSSSLERRLDERVTQLVRRRRHARPVRGFDDGDWPLVVVTVGADDDDEHLAALLDCVSAAHLRGPFGLVVDLRAAPELGAARRSLLAAARGVDEKHFSGVQRARAVVVADERARRAMMVVGWLRPTAYPVELFTKREDAIVWACARSMKRS